MPLAVPPALRLLSCGVAGGGPNLGRPDAACPPPIACAPGPGLVPLAPWSAATGRGCCPVDGPPAHPPPGRRDGPIPGGRAPGPPHVPALATAAASVTVTRRDAQAAATMTGIAMTAQE